ncbi:SGNH/GDSL hydrolase family protein [Shimazuella sp. AN120528]|uniref:SGNH/GDSL hydrolase family protein n=1 Tax=Shimazuella soli TaxID=1892854 RepID=UPI001F0EA56E|nr:SGNH/GDSL hydrolase family protein [Shimazuella soli]MCH5584056.1 SGNH/GDSL hydrolase family protein [Shimazuella soli]
MKKVTILMFALTLLSTFVLPYSSFASPQKTHHSSLVALGDSITFGYNLGDNQSPSPYAFPYLMGANLNKKVENLGVPGWTSGDLLQALQTEKFQTAVEQAKIITLDIGSNDILRLASQYGLLNPENAQKPIQLTPEQQKGFEQATQQFAENLPIIIQHIKQFAPSSKIVLYNLYNPFPSASIYLHPLSESMIGQLNTIIENNANKFHLKVADAHAAFDEQQYTLVRLAQNDVHPTMEGQKVLAQLGEQILHKKRKVLAKHES